MCLADSFAPCLGILGTVLGLDSSASVAVDKGGVEQTIEAHSV